MFILSGDDRLRKNKSYSSTFGSVTSERKPVGAGLVAGERSEAANGGSPRLQPGVSINQNRASAPAEGDRHPLGAAPQLRFISDAILVNPQNPF